MRVRLLALLSALTLFGLAAVPASADSEGHDYVALGDSVPFGFNPLLNPNDASNFVGYPEIVAQGLDIKDVNATCPGEATGGFLSLTGTDNVCRPYRAAFPLHIEYNTSQMDFALRYLKGHRDTRLITLTIGANDLFRFQKDCTVDLTFGTCPLGLSGVLATIGANLHTIFSNIRSTGYTGLIVAVTYYALDYSDKAGVALTLAGQGITAAAGSPFKVKIASGFNAWAPVAAIANGDSCAAGLLIRVSPTKCDVHPTPAGRDLLAAAVLSTIAASCPAHDAIECLDVNR